jgi:hypothetical protein
VAPVLAWGTPWLPCEAGHAVAGPVPDRAGGGRLAPPMPREDPPSPGTGGHRHGRGRQPRYVPNSAYVPRSGKGPEALEAPPQVVLRPAPRWTWGVRSRLSARIAEMLPLHDTTGHQVPRWEPLRFSLVAWSPPLVRRAYFSVPSGFPHTASGFVAATSSAINNRSPQPRPAADAQRLPR